MRGEILTSYTILPEAPMCCSTEAETATAFGNCVATHGSQRTEGRHGSWITNGFSLVTCHPPHTDSRQSMTRISRVPAIRASPSSRQEAFHQLVDLVVPAPRARCNA